MCSCSKRSDVEGPFAEDVVSLHTAVLIAGTHHGHSERGGRHDGGWSSHSPRIAITQQAERADGG